MNAVEVVERALRAGREQDVEALVGLMAPDGHIEWPYHPPGVPSRVTGRERIREFLAGTATGLIRFDEYRNVVIHQTTDPAVVIAEYDVEGAVVASGAPFRQTVIAVFRVRDGLITSCRDYVNPLPLMEALNPT